MEKEKEIIKLNIPFEDLAGHARGDEGIIEEFVKLLKGEIKETLSNIEESIESHLMAFASKESRLNNKVINMDYIREKFYS